MRRATGFRRGLFPSIRQEPCNCRAGLVALYCLLSPFYLHYIAPFSCIIISVYPAVPRITTSHVPQQRPVIPQYPPPCTKHLDPLFDVFCRRLLEANLSRYAVIAKPPIWWRRYASMNKSILQSTE